MAACAYCGQRKGKRSCPALAGAICTSCCGQHRLRDINCPDDCVHLGGLAVARKTTPVDFTRAEFDAAWKKLYLYADRAGEFRAEALLHALEHDEPSQWELELAAAYLFHGHRDASGKRLIDHFIAACGRDLPRGEIAAIIALRDAWASMFEVVSVRAGVGLELRDIRSGELLDVRDVSATAQAHVGDVIFGWIMALPDRLELSGFASMIPSQHRERVRSAIEAELAILRARWPEMRERELVGATAWVVADTMRAAAREALARELDPSRGSPVGPPEVQPTETATHGTTTPDNEDGGEGTGVEPRTAHDASRDPAGELGEIAYDAMQAPADDWTALDEPSRQATIEAYHRALGLEVPRTHAALHLIVENQLAAGIPPETRATLDRLVAEGLDRHEAIHAIGSVVATAISNVMQLAEPVDRDAIIRELAELRAEDWRSEPAPAASAPHRQQRRP